MERKKKKEIISSLQAGQTAAADERSVETCASTCENGEQIMFTCRAERRFSISKFFFFFYLSSSPSLLRSRPITFDQLFSFFSADERLLPE